MVINVGVLIAREKKKKKAKIVRLKFLYHITDKISHTMQIQPPSWFCHGCEVLNQNLNEHAHQNKAPWKPDIL